MTVTVEEKETDSSILKLLIMTVTVEEKETDSSILKLLKEKVEEVQQNLETTIVKLRDEVCCIGVELQQKHADLETTIVKLRDKVRELQEKESLIGQLKITKKNMECLKSAKMARPFGLEMD
ncbi:hypothetical protein CRG98_004541 [Punica granatum]|uniref:Uncharacterized protein n=1 Tax=Punica granatum TaxID=22663 RepID=A0A2I0L2Y4_PUNGR|nr:hypothetical protein CRG98_004541 [Punica granatum]